MRSSSVRGDFRERPVRGGDHRLRSGDRDDARELVGAPAEPCVQLTGHRRQDAAGVGTAESAQQQIPHTGRELVAPAPRFVRVAGDAAGGDESAEQHLGQMGWPAAGQHGLLDMPHDRQAERCGGQVGRQALRLRAGLFDEVPDPVFGGSVGRFRCGCGRFRSRVRGREADHAVQRRALGDADEPGPAAQPVGPDLQHRNGNGRRCRGVPGGVQQPVPARRAPARCERELGVGRGLAGGSQASPDRDSARCAATTAGGVAARSRLGRRSPTCAASAPSRRSTMPSRRRR